MNDPKFVASCSGGKDSVATLILAAENNEPLDEAIFSEVMFDKDTSGEGAVKKVPKKSRLRWKVQPASNYRETAGSSRRTSRFVVSYSYHTNENY